MAGKSLVLDRQTDGTFVAAVVHGDKPPRWVAVRSWYDVIGLGRSRSIYPEAFLIDETVRAAAERVFGPFPDGANETALFSAS